MASATVLAPALSSDTQEGTTPEVAQPTSTPMTNLNNNKTILNIKSLKIATMTLDHSLSGSSHYIVLKLEINKSAVPNSQQVNPIVQYVCQFIQQINMMSDLIQSLK